MKKCVLVILPALLLFFVTAACGSTEDIQEGGGVGPDSSGSTQSLSEASSIASGPISEASSAQPLAEESAPTSVSTSVSAPESMSSEVYRCFDDEFGTPFMEEYTPILNLYPDGTFDMIVNLYEGMGHVKGDYTSSESGFSMTVTSWSWDGVVGEDVDSFEFIKNNDGLIYSGEPIGATADGVSFVRQ